MDDYKQDLSRASATVPGWTGPARDARLVMRFTYLGPARPDREVFRFSARPGPARPGPSIVHQGQAQPILAKLMGRDPRDIGFS